MADKKKTDEERASEEIETKERREEEVKEEKKLEEEKPAAVDFQKEASRREKELLNRVTEAMRGRLESQIPVSDNYWNVLNEYRQFVSSMSR